MLYLLIAALVVGVVCCVLMSLYYMACTRSRNKYQGNRA